MKGVSGNPALDAYNRMSVSAVNASQTVRRAEPAQAENKPEPQQNAAKVTISNEARQLATGAAEAQVNTQKVDALRSQLESGNLKLDSRLIASRMVDALG
jgi:flagellar biosynthesis anti-sigma factor FlgM